MSIPRVYRAKDIANVVAAIRKAYHAALLAPAHWAPTEFDVALDCVLLAVGIEPDEPKAPDVAERSAEQVRAFVSGEESHELGDKPPTLDDMEY